MKQKIEEEDVLNGKKKKFAEVVLKSFEEKNKIF